ncbi:hypothetical protein SM124_09000 [Bacillus sp. 31A1R]|uniref:Uncharacterized protein n=1 Tax=Robertmurraya mangrovi TaxID=3098077 RepID=A0ABU5IXL5_9BACI|nr:hypothetical protein [Bacillus sp. 31A1R]
MILFEKEKKFPTLEQLDQLTERLNLDLTYFFEMASKNKQNYFVAVQELINKYKRERNYKAIYEIVYREEENPSFQHTSLKQFLLWHKGICIYYLENNTDKAMKFLYQAIELTNSKRKDFSEREIEILNSIGLILYENKDFQNAKITLNSALASLEKLPNIVDDRVVLKVLFSLSQVLSELGSFEESLQYSKKGISHCINKELLYLFAEFHYQTGENYIKLEEIEKGKNYIEESIKILKLQGNEIFAQIFQEELEKLLSRC